VGSFRVEEGILAGRIMVEGAKSSGSMSEGSDSRSESDTSSIRALRDMLIDMGGLVRCSGFMEGQGQMCAYQGTSLKFRVTISRIGTSVILEGFLVSMYTNQGFPNASIRKYPSLKSNPLGHESLCRNLLRTKSHPCPDLANQRRPVRQQIRGARIDQLASYLNATLSKCKSDIPKPVSNIIHIQYHFFWFNLVNAFANAFFSFHCGSSTRATSLI